MGDETITLGVSPTGTTDLDNDNDPNEIDQGDTAEWVLTYENNTDDPIANAQINNDLSAGQEYVVGSAHAPSGWDVEFSTDGGTTYGAAEPASGVTDIQFINPLAPADATGTLSVISEPLAPVSQGTDGDGFIPILAGNRIYAIFHHQRHQFTCIDRTTNAICPGYPKQVTQTVSDGIRVFQAANSPGGGIAFGDRFYTKGYRLGNATIPAPFGLICWDGTTDDMCADGDFIEMVPHLPIGPNDSPRAGGPQAIGDKIYVITDNHQIHCLDVNTNALCTGYPKNTALIGATGVTPSTSVNETAGQIDMETDVATGRIYGVYKGHLHCFDTNTDAPCADWASNVSFNNGTYNTGGDRNFGLFFRTDATGVRNGICTRFSNGGTTSTPTCYDLDGTNPVVQPAAFNCGSGDRNYCGLWQIYTDTSVGTRVIFSSSHRPDGSSGGSAFCWDWATNAPCQGPGYDANGKVDHYVNQGNTNTGEYGAVTEGSCVFNLGHAGLLHTFDAITGTAPCAAVDPTTLSTLSVSPADFACGSDTISFTWDELKVFDTDLTAGVHFDVFNVTILDGNNNPILGPVDMVDGTGTLDLSGISSSVTTIKALVNPVTVDGNPAWSNGRSPKLTMSFDGPPIEFCFETTPTLDCEALPDSISDTATTSFSGATASDSLSVYPAEDCAPETGTITIIKDTVPDNGQDFDFTLSGPNQPGAEPYSFVTKWGSGGVGNTQFNYPFGIDVDSSGNVYVADWLNRRVSKFDSNGTFITSFSQPASATDVAIDGSGNIYVLASVVVRKLDSSGTLINQWGGGGSADGQLNNATGIDIDSSGNIYVADSGNNRVQKFTNNGTFITKWGSAGTGTGQFQSLRGIAVDSNGNVYTTEGNDPNRIQKFDSNGNFITTIGGFGSGDGQFKEPQAIAIDSNDKLYVADATNYRIQILDSDGNFLGKWGSSGSNDGQFNLPRGIVVDSNGDVYVSDSFNYRVQKFAPVSSDTIAFSLDDDLDDTLPNMQVYDDLDPGEYTLTELATDGYTTTLSCEDPSGGTTTNGAIATIDLEAGDTVTCTYTNSLEEPEIACGTDSVDTDGDGIFDHEDIDDDNDGILDINEGLIASGGLLNSLFPNPDFEDNTGLPTTWAQMDLVNDWVQVTNATSDYFHEDGWMGTAEIGFMPPTPSGKGFVGSLDATTFVANYAEYAGNVLNDPLVPGQEYAFDLLLGAPATGTTNAPVGGAGGDYNGQIVIYGSVAVPTFPLATSNPLSGVSGWEELYRADVNVPADSWVETSVHFTADQAYTTIAFGGENADPFFRWLLFDRLQLNVAIPADIDGDDIPNACDLDSDNDGISDLVESGSDQVAADANNDGTVSAAEAAVAIGGTADSDQDGLMDIFDENTGSTDPVLSEGTLPVNSDSTDESDFLDLDSDNDGIPDAVEAQATAGYAANFSNDGDVTDDDSDRDGVIDIYDDLPNVFGGTFNTPQNTDTQDNPDYIDENSDNDAFLDSAERGAAAAPTYADPNGSINNPQTDLPNEVDDTSEVAYREIGVEIPEISIDDVTIVEGTGGTTTMEFTVSLSNNFFDTSVTANTADGVSATIADSPADYGPIINEVINFVAGGDLTKTISVDITTDAIVEADETFIINLSNPVNGVITDSQGLGTIENDDKATLKLSGGTSRTELDSGQVAYVFYTILQDPVQGGFSIDIASLDLTATVADNDYEANSDTLTFVGNADERHTFTILANGDEKVEADEAFAAQFTSEPDTPLKDLIMITTEVGRYDLDYHTAKIFNDDSAILKLSGGTSVEEGDSGQKAYVFTATLQDAVQGGFDIDYANLDRTAKVSDDDYDPVRGTLSFAGTAGEQHRVTVYVNGDEKVEADEVFALAFTSDPQTPLADDIAISGAPDKVQTYHEATIFNDDKAVVTLSGPIEKMEGDNGTTRYTFTAKLFAEVDGGFDLAYSTDDGSAVLSDNDYNDNDGTLRFSGRDGETHTITVDVNGDTVGEAHEFFYVTLGEGIADRLGIEIITANSPRKGIITNDDSGVLFIDVGEAEVNEDAGTLSIEVELSNVKGGAVTVDYAVTAGTATANADFTPVAGSLNFAAGELVKTIEIPIIDDNVAEASESIVVELTNPSGAGLGNHHLTEVTILDDDRAPQVRLASSEISVSESASSAVVRLTLDTPSQAPVTVKLMTVDGSAKGGSDYTASEQTVTFAPGETTATATIIILGDDMYERDETLELMLTEPVNAELVSEETTVLTIEEDDPAPNLSVSDVSMCEPESGEQVVSFEIELSAISAVDISVQFATQDGTAEDGIDYLSNSGTLIIPAGTTKGTISVIILGDDFDEDDETFTLSLFELSDGLLDGTASSGTVTGTITNSDHVNIYIIYLPVVNR